MYIILLHKSNLTFMFTVRLYIRAQSASINTLLTVQLTSTNAEHRYIYCIMCISSPISNLTMLYRRSQREKKVLNGIVVISWGKLSKLEKKNMIPALDLAAGHSFQ